MLSSNKKTVIDGAYGSITNKYAQDKVILVGRVSYENNNYVKDLQLVINRESDLPLTIDIPYSGYNMQLFVGDFIGDTVDNIMIRGEYESRNNNLSENDNFINYELAVIYKYENESLIEIFNIKDYETLSYSYAKFKNNYRTSLTCGKKKYLIDLSARSKEYLRNIYDENKKVKTSLSPTLDSSCGIYPIKQSFKNHYELLIYRKIVGIDKYDVIGTVETLLELEDNNMNIIYEGLLSYPHDEVEKTRKYDNNMRNTMEGSRFIKSYSSTHKNNEFKKDDLNLMIKSMDEEDNILYVDAYLLNLKSYELKSLSNLKIILKDNEDRIISNKVFNKVDIGKGIKPNEKRRILLSFSPNEYNILDDFSIYNLVCEINYDARS